MTFNSHSSTSWLVAACAILVVPACARSPGGHEGGAGGQEVVVGTGDGIFPAETLTDWVSYAIQLSEVSILSESEIPPPDSVYQRGEGYIGRTITASIGKTFWISPAGGAVSGNINITVAGWVLQRGDRNLFAIEMSPRIEVGGRYVMPLVTAPDGSGNEAWGPLSTESVFEQRGDRVATDDVHARGNSVVAQALAALSDSELQRILAETAPDPIAAKYWDLAPYQRWRAVGTATR